MNELRRGGIVFLGGGFGACARALLLQFVASWTQVIPLDVLLVNLTGSFILGVVWVLADELDFLGRDTRLFVAVGFLGGYTTFSTFGWGVDLLLARGSTVGAVVYVLASLIGGIGAVAAGLLAGRESTALLARAAPSMLVRLEESRRRPHVASKDMSAIETENREESG